MYPWSTKDEGSRAGSWSRKYRGLKHRATQLDCTTSIKSTQNNGIHDIFFSQHMTFNRLDYLVNKQKFGSYSTWGVHLTTSKWNLSNLQMLYKSSSLKWIFGSAMMVGLKTIRISSEQYTTGIFPNAFNSFWDISYLWCISILTTCSSRTPKFDRYTARHTLLIGDGVCKISIPPERWLCQSFVHSPRLTWTNFLVISMVGRCISQWVIFTKISAGYS